MGPSRLNTDLIGHTVISIAWLGFLTLVNRHAQQPIVSIFPYLAPVVFFAWVQGAAAGFLIAGLATLAAIPGGYLETHAQNDVLYAGLSTYAKLTGAVIGVTLAKRVHERSGRS